MLYFHKKTARKQKWKQWDISQEMLLSYPHLRNVMPTIMLCLLYSIKYNKYSPNLCPVIHRHFHLSLWVSECNYAHWYLLYCDIRYTCDTWKYNLSNNEVACPPYKTNDECKWHSPKSMICTFDKFKRGYRYVSLCIHQRPTLCLCVKCPNWKDQREDKNHSYKW